MRKIRGWDLKVMDGVGLIIFAILTALLIIQVFARYIFRISFPWIEEIARFMLIYIVFIGAMIATKEKFHLATTDIFEKLSLRTYLRISIARNLAIIFFLIPLFVGDFLMVRSTWDQPVSSILWLSKGWIYLIIGISAAVMIIYLLIQIMNMIRRLIFLQKEK